MVFGLWQVWGRRGEVEFANYIPQIRAPTSRTPHGITNSRGRGFNRAAIHWVLTNDFYTGKVQYDGKIVEGDHEVIVSPVLFGKVQKALSRRAKVKTKEREL